MQLIQAMATDRAQGIIAPVDHTDRTNCQNTHQKTAASTTGRGFIVPKKGD